MKIWVLTILFFQISCAGREIQLDGCFFGNCKDGYGGKRFARQYAELTRFESREPWSHSETYIGDWLNGLRHGHGTLDSIHKFTYTGEWYENQMSGEGHLRITVHYTEPPDPEHPNGKFSTHDAVYKGKFKSNNPNGYGKMVIDNKITYEGEWQSAYPAGVGKITYASGATCTGTFLVDRNSNPNSILPSANYAIVSFTDDKGKKSIFQFDPYHDMNLIVPLFAMFSKITC